MLRFTKNVIVIVNDNSLIKNKEKVIIKSIYLVR